MEDPILATFEQAAERAGDITADIYRRYYARCPEAEQVMSHVDPYMQGRMMDEVLTLVMTDPAELPDGYLKFETANHASYGVALSMYPDLLRAVLDTVRDIVGDDWSNACEAAWNRRIATLVERIEAAAPASPNAAAAR
jgi:hemoglobin-like flavoprotein